MGLDGLAESLKWMSMDFGWWAVSERQHGTKPEHSNNYKAYESHRENVRRILHRDKLFWPLNHFVADTIWYPINSRLGGDVEGTKAKAASHKKHYEDELSKILAEKAWPLAG